MKKSIRQLRRALRKPSIPLGGALVVPFVLEVVAVVGLTVYWAYQHSQTTVNDLANQLMTEMGDRAEGNLNNYFERVVQVTDDYANQINLNLIDWQNESTLAQIFLTRLQRINATERKLYSLLMADSRQRLVAIENVDQDEWRIHGKRSKSLQHLERQLTGFKPTSALLPKQIKFEFKQDLAQEKTPHALFSEQALDDGVWQLKTLSERKRATLVLTYFRHFIEKTHQVHGVVGASIDLEGLGDYLNSLKIVSRGQIFLMDEKGALVAASTAEPLLAARRKTVGGSADPTTRELAASDARSRVVATQSADASIRAAAQFLMGQARGGDIQRQHFSFTADEKQYLLQVIPLQSLQGLNWRLVLVIPRSMVAGQVDRQYHQLFILSAIALLGAIALGLLTAQHITRPILRLSQASQDLMLGKLDAPIKEQSCITELAILAHSFNDMTNYLFQSFDQVRLALQESKEKFTTIFRTSPDPIIISALPEGTILEANESFFRLMGYSRSQALGRTATELGLWSTTAMREEFLHAVQQMNKVYNQEIKARTQSGRQITVLLSSEVIELDGRSCLLTIAKDITERKRLEEALQRSEAQLQDVLNSVAAAICQFYVDPAGSLQSIYFSAGTTSVFGYTPEHLLRSPSSWANRVHPNDWQQVVEPCFATAARGQSLTIEYRYRQPESNDWRWISSELLTRWDTTQHRWLVTAVALDVTDRKQADTSLRVSEERFRLAFDAAMIGMDIAAADGQLIQVNPALCQMLGYSEAELLQCTYRDLTHPEDLLKDYAANGLLLSGAEDSVTFEKRLIHKNGQIIWTLLSLSLVRDPQQMPLYWIAQLQDISDRKQMEKALNRSEDRFRAVFEMTTTGMAIADLNGTIIEANSALCRLCHYSKSELHQMSIPNLLHVDDQSRWLNLLQELCCQTLEHFQLNTYIATKNGFWTLGQLTALVMRDAQQNPLYLVIHIEPTPFPPLPPFQPRNSRDLEIHPII